MNVERLHSLIGMVLTHLDEKEIVKKWADLVTSLQSAISNPGDQEGAKVFNEKYQAFKAMWDDDPFSRLPPSYREMLRTIDPAGFIGPALLEKFDATVNGNRVAVALAVPMLKGIEDELAKYHAILQGISLGFERLNIEKDKLPPGSAEIGFSIPKGLFQPDLNTFAKEIRQYNYVLNAFNELATNNEERIELRTISSSDWQIYVVAAPAVLAAVAWGLTKISEILRRTVEIRELWQKLVNSGLPPESTDPLKAHIDTQIERETRQLAEEATQVKFRIDDQARQNELTNQLSQAFKFLASKMDSGVTIDLRISLPNKPSEEEGVGDRTPEQQEILRQQVLTYTQLRQIRNDANEARQLMAEVSAQAGGQLRLPAPDLAEERTRLPPAA